MTVHPTLTFCKPQPPWSHTWRQSCLRLMLTAAYFMLRDDVDYHDLCGRYLVDRDKQHLTKSLLRRLRDLGVVVEVKAA